MKPYLSDPDLTIYNRDALAVLSKLPGESVDCCVTSPPYSDARSDVAAVSPDEFPEWLVETLRDLPGAMQPQGSLLLNLGRRFRDGEELDYADAAVRLLCRAGWKRIDTLIWKKTNPAGKGSPYLTNAHETVFWLARSVDAYRGYDETRRPYSVESIARFQRAPRPPAKNDTTRRPGTPPHPLGAKPWSVFECSVGKEKGLEHPTPMALDLALHLVKLGSPPGGVVLDPFCGEGTTLLAARKLGRSAIGIDIDEDYCALAARRTQQLSLEASA